MPSPKKVTVNVWEDVEKLKHTGQIEIPADPLDRVLGQEEAVYLGAHKAVHCIVEITDDFRIQEDSLLRCRRRLNDMLQGQTKAIHMDQRVITRRIITEKTSGRFCRYDHLWIDIDV